MLFRANIFISDTPIAIAIQERSSDASSKCTHNREDLDMLGMLEELFKEYRIT